MPFTLKHILGSLLIGALAFVAFGLYGSAVQRNWAEEQISGEVKASAQAQAQRLSTSLSNLWRVVEMLSEEASAQPADLQRTLTEARLLNPALTLLGLAKVDGTVIASAGGDETTVSQAPWFTSALRNPIVKALASDAGSAIVLAKPVKNKDGITIAVLFACVGMEGFVTSATGPAGLPGKIILAANDGRHLLAWRSAEPSIAHQRSHEIESTSSTRLSDRNEWLTASARATSGGAFPETGWSLTVALSKAVVDQRVAPAMRQLWAGCFAVAVLALLTAAAWTAWLAAPLKAISLFATAAAEGKKVDPVSETRFREAAILSNSLLQLWTGLQRTKAPKAFRIVANEAEVVGESDLVFDDLVSQINALMDHECETKAEIKQTIEQSAVTHPDLQFG